MNENGQMLAQLTAEGSAATSCQASHCDYYLVDERNLKRIPRMPGLQSQPDWSQISNSGVVAGTASLNGVSGAAVYSNGVGKFYPVSNRIPYNNSFLVGGTVSDAGLTLIRAYQSGNGPTHEMYGTSYLLNTRTGLLTDIRSLVPGTFGDRIYSWTINARSQILLYGNYNGVEGEFLLTPVFS